MHCIGLNPKSLSHDRFMTNHSPQPSYHILAAIRDPEDFRPLLNVGYSLAKANEGMLTIITARQTRQDLEWLKIPPAMTDILIKIEQRENSNPAKAILRQARHIMPNLVLLGLERPTTQARLFSGQHSGPGFTTSSL